MGPGRRDLHDRDALPASARGAELQRAYQHFAQMSRACQLGRDATVRNELDKAEKYLGQAAAKLAPFGLRP